MQVLDEDAVRATFPMPVAVDVMRAAMSAHGRGEVFQPPRTVYQAPQIAGSTFLKQAVVGGEDTSFGLKVITFFPDNIQRGLPSISGFVALFDPETGNPLAMLHGGVVTEIRTGAVSGVATDALARPDAGDLALIGAGTQARSHLAAMAAVRQLRRVRVWARDRSKAQAFAAWAAGEGHTVEPCGSVDEAVAGADLICTVTSSPDPLVDGDMVAPGAHINAVGAFQADSRELHTDLVAKATVVVDSREETAKAAGDLLFPIKEGALPPDPDFAELGEVLTGKRTGREGPNDITVYESLGLALQDVAAAAHVVRATRERGLGIDVSF